ncbi:hypothetical protein RF11_13057 [Thelohanellus kitauei]|uniref:Uncharacterized protein n=1 Tax=Thelohanellus kitauei TaxID=669202 RepID=A0A0C2MRG6_THEKT|nr:hypothetical protein RF11_13057 [Thelohanellus kitauei]
MKRQTRYFCFYDKRWEEMFPITHVKGNRHSYHCIVCKSTFSCAQNGIRNVKRHCESLRHSRKVTEKALGKRNRESICDVSTESPFQLPIYESRKRMLNSTFSITTVSEPALPDCETIISGIGDENVSQLFETSSQINEETMLENINVNDSLNVMPLREMTTIVNCIVYNNEAVPNQILAMDLNVEQEIKDIKEELKSLQITLKDILNYLRYVF